MPADPLHAEMMRRWIRVKLNIETDVLNLTDMQRRITYMCSPSVLTRKKAQVYRLQMV